MKKYILFEKYTGNLKWRVPGLKSSGSRFSNEPENSSPFQVPEYSTESALKIKEKEPGVLVLVQVHFTILPLAKAERIFDGLPVGVVILNSNSNN